MLISIHSSVADTMVNLVFNTLGKNKKMNKSEDHNTAT